MPRRKSFERRLLLALVLFSLAPSLLLIGIGTFLLSETVSLSASAAAWERVAASGRGVLEAAERSGDSTLAAAALRHREELSASLVQSSRWEYLNERALEVIPIVAILLALVLVWLAFRSAHAMARELASPIRELVDWSAMIAREEALPPPVSGDRTDLSEFGVLHDAFRNMAGELALSRARALEAERARTWVNMARSVAHELKNPLTPLRLAIRTLQRRAPGLPDAEALDVLETESRRLEELAHSFAQFGHLPEGPTSEIDLRELFDYLLRAHLPEAVSSRLRAPVDLPHVDGHHDALARAFANLLLNAVDAMGPKGGAITVVLSTSGDAAEIRILDSGPGIPEELIESIWEPDFSTKSRGTGLGLALVRQTIHAHGGGIWAKNRPDGGAEFRVLLPGGANSYQLSAIS
ncbi:MAG TPA: HAMP domain-containing sensor histidine kinase [Longimicrobiaceae bacterium]|nr:HAMP domain-containing sensor histidine kinase [Longimicrobiaceae bacterium]